MEPPPIRDIVLAVATMCANNSLVCQLLFLPQWETGKRKEGRSERKYARLLLKDYRSGAKRRHLDVFLFFIPFLS